MYDSLWSSTPRSNRQTGVAALIVAALTVPVWACAASPAQAADGPGLDAEIPAVEAPATPTHLLARGAGYGKQGGLEAVRSLQRLLRRHGYEPGPIDGLYGPLTEAAVERFQRANDLAVDGVVGPRTSGRLVAQQQRSRPQGAEPVRPGAGYGRPGGSRPVREIQRLLLALGYDCGPVDGLFGPRTQAAVQWFQAKHGLPPSGVVGPTTRRSLRPLSPGKPAAPELVAPPHPAAGWHGRPISRPHVHHTSTTSASGPRRNVLARPLHPGAGYRSAGGSLQVRRIQGMLRRLGYEAGAVDGRFGPRTKASVQWFQLKHGFHPSGTIDRPTLRHLRAVTGGSAPALRATNGRARQPAAARVAERPAPRRSRATADDGRALDPLLVALFGALAAIGVTLLSITVRRRREGPDGETASDGRGPRTAGAPPRARAHRPPGRLPRPGADRGPAAAGSQNRGTAPAAARRRKVGGTASPRAVGYATGHDRPELERHAAAIERACRERAWTLAGVVRDHGSRTPKPLERPGLLSALKQLHDGVVGRLVVDRLEHLGGSAADLRPLLQWCARNGVDLVALDVGLDTTTHKGRQAADYLLAVGNGHGEPRKPAEAEQ